MWISIAPGSGEIENHKRWPQNKFTRLINAIHEKIPNIGIILLGNRIEINLNESIEKSVINKELVFNFTGKTSIEETAHLLYLCNLTIANCNGLSHLASAVGSKVIGLYGPTDPKFTGPFTSRLFAVSLKMSCSPCYKRGYITGCGNPVCLSDLTVKQVFDTVQKVVIKKNEYSIGRMCAR